MIIDWITEESEFDSGHGQSLTQRVDRLLWADPLSCHRGLFPAEIATVSKSATRKQ